jgi:hypothetical protein
MSWSDFSTAFSAMRFILEDISYLDFLGNEVDRLVEFRQLTKLVEEVSGLMRKSATIINLKPKFNLEYLVTHKFTSFITTDPRDTIYALLSIAKDTNGSGRNFDQIRQELDRRLVPDYAKSLLDVYTDFIDYCITTSGSLDILCRPWASASGEYLPSWICTVQQRTVLTESIVGSPLDTGDRRHDSSAGRRPRFNFGGLVLSKSTLQVKGLRLDEVTQVSPPVSGNLILNQASGFWQTLVAGFGPNRSKMPLWYGLANVELWRFIFKAPHEHAKGVDNVLPLPARLFYRRARPVVRDRVFFNLLNADNSASPGLGPQDTQSGDIVCILFGCSVPVVLREFEEEGNHYFKLIGECYIHGLMDGEAFDHLDPEPVYPYDDSETFALR